MRFGVVVCPRTWSDCDFHYVISEVLHQPVKYVWHRDRGRDDLDCVVLRGGFSYGDYLRAGAIAGRSPVVEALRDLVARGGCGLGSCNGFQILCEAGVLPRGPMRNKWPQDPRPAPPPLVEGGETPLFPRPRPGQGPNHPHPPARGQV